MPGTPRDPNSPQSSQSPLTRKRTSFLGGMEMQNTGLLADIIRNDQKQFGRDAPPDEWAESSMSSVEPQAVTSADIIDIHTPGPIDSPQEVSTTKPQNHNNTKTQSDKTTKQLVVNTTKPQNVPVKVKYLPGRKGKRREIHSPVRPRRPMSLEEAVTQVFGSLDNASTVHNVRVPDELYDMLKDYIGMNHRHKITIQDVFARGLMMTLIETMTGEQFIDLNQWGKQLGFVSDATDATSEDNS